MKVKAKVPFFDRKGLHKKNDVVEIETAAFNPYTMVEIPEAKTKKVAPVEVYPTEEVATVEKVEEEAKTPVKKTRKKKV